MLDREGKNGVAKVVEAEAVSQCQIGGGFPVCFCFLEFYVLMPQGAESI